MMDLLRVHHLYCCCSTRHPASSGGARLGIRPPPYLEEETRHSGPFFTLDILCNLYGHGIENYIMGHLMDRGVLAVNHCMDDLLRALEQQSKLPSNLVAA